MIFNAPGTFSAGGPTSRHRVVIGFKPMKVAMRRAWLAENGSPRAFSATWPLRGNCRDAFRPRPFSHLRRDRSHNRALQFARQREKRGTRQRVQWQDGSLYSTSPRRPCRIRGSNSVSTSASFRHSVHACTPAAVISCARHGRVRTGPTAGPTPPQSPPSDHRSRQTSPKSPAGLFHERATLRPTLKLRALVDHL